MTTTALHTEPCGCQYEAIDVPDDAWIGQGWRLVKACGTHPRPICATCSRQFSCQEARAGYTRCERHQAAS